MSDSTRSQDVAITKAPPRSERFYSDNELWYFRTREQAEVGPFRYRSEAQTSLERFLRDLKDRLESP
jgi:hypothetical protein